VIRDISFDSPVAKVVTRLASERLAQAARAAKRLDNPDDSEALHDFRVALRRLRSLLRAYRDYVSVPGRLRRRLKRLTRATNRARDLEVMLGWIAGARRAANPAERATLDWWRAALAQQLEEANALVRDEARQDFHALRRRFEVRPGRRAAGAQFGEATARLLTGQQQALEAALAAIGGVEHAEAIHTARIEAKRLRYLIEPLAAELPSAAVAVRAFKECQDRFGVLCDAFVRARELTGLAETLAARRARAELETELHGSPRVVPAPAPTPAALAQFARRMRAETRRLFAAVERHYLKDGASKLFARVQPVQAALATRTARSGKDAEIAETRRSQRFSK
jgi:CHAD domain-containing protein